MGTQSIVYATPRVFAVPALELKANLQKLFLHATMQSLSVMPFDGIEHAINLQYSESYCLATKQHQVSTVQFAPSINDNEVITGKFIIL